MHHCGYARTGSRGFPGIMISGGRYGPGNGDPAGFHAALTPHHQTSYSMTITSTASYRHWRTHGSGKGSGLNPTGVAEGAGSGRGTTAGGGTGTGSGRTLRSGKARAAQRRRPSGFRMKKKL
jgi:hypothetical protein